MKVTPEDIKNLRQSTGAGMMDCKKALIETSGDLQKAIDWLRKKGLDVALKKSGRVATQGVVGSYIHGEGKIGALVEVNSETDFVARNQEFKDFVKDVAIQVVAGHPLCVDSKDFPLEEIEKEKNILEAKALEQGIKKELLSRVVEGQLTKWKKQKTLLMQSFVKNPDKTMQELLTETIAKVGENIVIRRFTRYELGEGIEVQKAPSFADEVRAAQKQG